MVDDIIGEEPAELVSSRPSEHPAQGVAHLTDDPLGLLVVLSHRPLPHRALANASHSTCRSVGYRGIGQARLSHSPAGWYPSGQPAGMRPLGTVPDGPNLWGQSHRARLLLHPTACVPGGYRAAGAAT